MNINISAMQIAHAFARLLTRDEFDTQEQFNNFLRDAACLISKYQGGTVGEVTQSGTQTLVHITETEECPSKGGIWMNYKNTEDVANNKGEKNFRSHEPIVVLGGEGVSEDSLDLVMNIDGEEFIEDGIVDLNDSPTYRWLAKKATNYYRDDLVLHVNVKTIQFLPIIPINLKDTFKLANENGVEWIFFYFSCTFELR
jgi:hypothetical protein